MTFYSHIFLGFYCLTKKWISKENSPEAYAVACMAAATSFFYFAATWFFVKRAATMLETAGVFLMLYAVHHFLFVNGDKYKQLESEVTCSDQLIYRSALFFVTGLSILMFVSGVG